VTGRLFEGIDFEHDRTVNNGIAAIPPDPAGAVGQNHVVTMVNRSIAWYTKAGTQQNHTSLSQFFGVGTQLPFDPKVAYDPFSDRFVAVALVNTTDEGTELTVTLAGKVYRVKSGRQQVLNLLISTFENAVEKNRELHRLNELLTLAKEGLTQWNITLESLNEQLKTANERMSRDLHAAARVQQSLLPSGQLDIPGVRVEWKYTPCEELAGDFLNYFLLDDQHLAMFVVDVSGHRAASSLLAVAIGRLLTSHASATSLLVQPDQFTGRPRITPPSAVVRELNLRFQMEGQGGLYFTIAYGILNVVTHELRYVSAGHPPMVHQPKGGRPCFLPGDGFAIGFVADTEFDEQVIKLQPGDRIYFYSDGVPEAMDAQLEQFSEERMLEVLARSATSSLDGSVDDLFAAVRTWCIPKGPNDDVSILSCEIAAESA